MTMRWDPVRVKSTGGARPVAGRAPDRRAPAVRRGDQGRAGRGLEDILWRVVCAGEGLPTEAEKGLGWPARSGKLVLRIALERVGGILPDQVRWKLARVRGFFSPWTVSHVSPTRPYPSTSSASMSQRSSAASFSARALGDPGGDGGEALGGIPGVEFGDRDKDRFALGDRRFQFLDAGGQDLVVALVLVGELAAPPPACGRGPGARRNGSRP